MIVLPERINADDLQQWLGGGICMSRHSDNAPWEPSVYELIHDVDAAGLPTLLTVRYGPHFDMRRVVPMHNIAGHWPMCGSVNVRDYKVAVHVNRKPAKQFKRTFSSRQVTVEVPRKWDVQKRIGATAGALRDCPIPVINAVFDPWYPVVDEAFVLLESGWTTIALNPRVIVAADETGKRMIYYAGELAAVSAGGRLDPVADLTTCRLIHKALAGRFSWTVDLQQ